jgi:thioredoxin-like negative regulator of GroEL
MSSTNQAPAAGPTPLTQFDFHHRLGDSAGVSIVMFGTVGCGGCRHLHRVLQQVARQRPKWHLFEVDAHLDAALCNEFEVFHLPSMFLFLNGTFHCALHAEARPAAVIAAAEAALAAPAEDAP